MGLRSQLSTCELSVSASEDFILCYKNVLIVVISDGQIQIMIWFKSWLNHWWWFDLSTKNLIWKHVIWFVFDFILCDLILWFEQITTFNNLGQGITITLLVFLPCLIFAETLTVRPDVHWWHFAYRLYSLELFSFNWHRDLIWFVICYNDLNLFVKWFVISDCDLIYDLPITCCYYHYYSVDRKVDDL